MTQSDQIIAEAEEYLSAMALLLSAPGAKECLHCYVRRMLTEFGCNGRQRWVARGKESARVGTSSLYRWLSSRGGCCCDCEVLFNVYREDLPESAAVLPPCEHGQRRWP
jgi:hypothetical protein